MMGSVRNAIAAAWIIGSAGGALLLSLVLFGCCVLPFHGMLHHALPLCTYFSHHDDDHHDATPAVPATAKPDPHAIWAKTAVRNLLPMPPALRAVAHDGRAIRNLVTLGALRVDDDVGLHALFATYLI